MLYSTMARLSLSKLRADLFRIVDEVIETGKPVEIERNGHIVRIVSEKKHSKLDALKPHPGAMLDDPESYVHIDWSEYWHPPE